MNTETFVFFIIIWFFGLTVGWCFKKNVFLGIIFLVITAKFIELLALADHWLLTGLFILGLLTHTWKPLYRKFKSL